MPPLRPFARRVAPQTVQPSVLSGGVRPFRQQAEEEKAPDEDRGRLLDAYLDRRQAAQPPPPAPERSPRHKLTIQPARGLRTTLQRKRISIKYNQNQGGLSGTLESLSSKSVEWFASLLAFDDFLPALKKAIDAVEDPTATDQQHIRDIMAKVGAEATRFYQTADPSKQLVGAAVDYEGVKSTVEGLASGTTYVSSPAFRADVYSTAISEFDWPSLTGIGKGTNLYKNYISKLAAISYPTKAGNPEIMAKIKNLFSWLIPLDRSIVKGVPNGSSLQNRLALLLTETIEQLQVQEGGVALPVVPIINHKPTKTIGDQEVGTESEIITSKAGARYSGEKAEGRGLETTISEQSGVRYVAGHLVAGSLGGKFADPNLTPITETFNTSGFGMQGPENGARIRLNGGKVIHYKATATYGNAERLDWRKYVPTAIRVEYSNMDPVEGEDPQDMKSYAKKSSTVVTNLVPF